MRSVVSENVQLAFETCRFLRSSVFSDDPELEIRSYLIAHDDFENSLLRLTRSIRAVLKPHANQSSQ